jgi:hypothetical protein
MSFSIETFKRIDHALRQMKDTGPRVWNGEAFVVKYLVRFEVINEPKEVIHKRIIDLWEHGGNIHHMDPLMEAAREHGLDLGPYKWASREVRAE